MRTIVRPWYLLLLWGACILLPSFLMAPETERVPFKMPYKKAGLSERQAAAHLLNRFTFGSRPGQVDEVLKTGLEKWFSLQLEGALPDDSLDRMLSTLDAMSLTNAEVVRRYVKSNEVIQRAIKGGLTDRNSVNKLSKAEYRSFVENYMKAHDLRPQQELYQQLIIQKIWRAVYSNNQLTEVLTDFWFNHFNVSIAKASCGEYIPGYERNVIRPRVTGPFGNLLLATAKSPAMLYYLDNSRSSGARAATAKKSGSVSTTAVKEKMPPKRIPGLNENYAREVMELHTLGVDGGYTQEDVTEAARVLTGWTVYPASQQSSNDSIEKSNEARLVRQGSIRDGDFLFAANRHDPGEKNVLGVKFTNEGYPEGVRLLDMLARHPSTARFISRKLAVRFVSDEPPQSLIDKMAETFVKKDGNIREMLITMVSSSEFWDTSAVREKIKSPFELAISAVRGLGANISDPYPMYSWIQRMGQKVYYYPAPTGFPDKAQNWINTGALLSRMNFGMALASQRVQGTKLNLPALNHYHEPESPAAALRTYGKILMPERELESTFKRLLPLLNDPDLISKIEAAAKKKMVARPDTALVSDEMSPGNHPPLKAGTGKAGQPATPGTAENSSVLAQVVGMLVGSPEFQRR